MAFPQKKVFNWKNFILPTIFAIIGILISSRQVIMFLNNQNPILGWVIYEIVIFTIFLTLAHFKVVIYKFHIEKIGQAIGAFLVTFSFFILFNFTNAYNYQIITQTTANPVGMIAPDTINIYFGSEDGMIYYTWTLLIAPTSAIKLLILRLLTFVITPFTLTFIGIRMIEKWKVNA